MSYKKSNKYKTRIKIEFLIKKGYSNPQIAKEIGINRTTVYREIKRNSPAGRFYYNADKADRMEYDRRDAENKTRAKFRNPEIRKKVLHEVTMYRSPEQVSHNLLRKKIKISHETIYKMLVFWLADGIDLYKYLRVQNKPKGKRGWQRTRGILQGNKKIHVSERNALHHVLSEEKHFYADLMEGKKDGICLVVLREARSSLVLAKLIPNKTAETFNKAVNWMLAEIDNIQSLTLDNGSETTEWNSLKESLKTKIYFCSPGKPWQKGSVENGIKQLRQFFPKGKSLKDVTQEEVNNALELINTRPLKKLLGFSAKNIFWQISPVEVPQVNWNVTFSLV